MDEIWQSLLTVLRQGHEELAEGLRQMVDAVRNDNYAAASGLAIDWDVKAGPHIEFEERYLYPVVENEEGEAVATRLYDEHADSIATLIELQGMDPDIRPSVDTKQRWLKGLQEAIDHLTRSYSLLDYLQPLSTQQLEQLLDSHARLRERGHRWSELHPRKEDSTPPAIGKRSGDSQDERTPN